MGLMRLGLALCVLVFHAGYGGAGGPIAVYGFYVLSGYLIYRVYLERYQPRESGLAAFYWNRFLRIFPLFLAASLLAYAALLVVGVPRAMGLPVNGVRYLHASGFSWADFAAGLRPDPVLKAAPAPQFIVYFGWLPQFWTISIELVFYLLAPAFCAARRQWGPRATWAILAGTGCLYAAYAAIPSPADLGLYSDIVYRNALPTLFFFAVGMMVYEVEALTTRRLPAAAAALCTLAVLALVLAGTRYVKLPLPAVPEFMVWQFLAAAGAVAVILSRPSRLTWLRRADGLFADVSYGVYLNQSVLLVFWFAWQAAQGHVDYPRIAFWQYLVLALATTVFSWLTLHAVERPCNRARADQTGQPGRRQQAKSHPLTRGKAV